MRRGASFAVSLVLALLLLCMSSRPAAAECNGDPEATPCGGGCVPGGFVCCDAVSVVPGKSCPDNTQCLTDGSCSCFKGETRCGDFCMPDGNKCCADKGHPGISCSPDHVCNDQGGCDPVKDTPECGYRPGPAAAGWVASGALLVAALSSALRRRRPRARSR